MKSILHDLTRLSGFRLIKVRSKSIKSGNLTQVTDQTLDFLTTVHYVVVSIRISLVLIMLTCVLKCVHHTLLIVVNEFGYYEFSGGIRHRSLSSSARRQTNDA